VKAALCAVLVSTLLVSAAALAEPAPQSQPCPAAASVETAAALVNLNSASEEQLQTLPGVGPSRAKAIVAFRAAHGGFTSVSQLMRIKGFGRAMLQRLRPLVTIDKTP
jgi:competence protein ComEA